MNDKKKYCTYSIYKHRSDRRLSIIIRKTYVFSACILYFVHAMQELYKPCNNDVKIPYNTEFGIYTCTRETHAKKSKYASGFSLDKKNCSDSNISDGVSS